MSDHTRTVLIVDDDPQILRLVEKMLRPRCINVLMAPRPSEALTICQNQHVDLLISDVAMPEMDGHKLVEKMLRPRCINVLMAPRPSEALTICQNQHVDLLISDVAMPEMDGHKLAERVLKIHPAAGVLLISGYFKDPPATPK